MQKSLSMLRIYCRNSKTYRECTEGSTLLSLLPLFDFPQPHEILAAKVNNVAEGLKYRIFNNRDIEFLDYTSYIGRNIYCRSLCFLLSKAVVDVFPAARVRLKRPISKGYFCLVDKNDGSDLSMDDIARVNERMKAMVEQDLPFRRHEVQTEQAIELFRRLGQLDKVRLLETIDDVYTTYYTLEDTADYYYYDALVPSTGYLKVWEVAPFHGGMLLRVPDRHDPDSLAPLHPQPKTFDVFSEAIKWNSIMGLDNVGDVNKSCQAGHVQDLIQVAEALQEKKIVQIAEEIDMRHGKDGVRLVLISGPSSSGKSTFCKRLSVQLMACGLHPVSISTDDYFVNRADTPKLPDGSYDFDNFDTVDHASLQDDMLRLLGGDEISVPEYDFVTGVREYNGKRLQLGDGSILLVEGIHALNPLLTDRIAESCKYRIFINAVTSISLDDHNCIPTSDNRLLRRIVRDHNKGAFTPKASIANWPNVRRAEAKWIYPYQETADTIFNSTYLAEFAVLRSHAERILELVPRNCREYDDAHRLMRFLHYFVPVSDKEVPPTSLIRSFIG